MEEMIKELAIKYQHNGSVLMNVFEFADSIAKVCKAQRNACARVYNKHYGIPNTMTNVAD